MPRLTHAVTGVRVEVSDDTAARLGDEWTPTNDATAEDTAPDLDESEEVAETDPLETAPPTDAAPDPDESVEAAPASAGRRTKATKATTSK